MQKLSIPANPDGVTYIYATQGENKARTYQITVIDISGQPVELEGTTAFFYVQKGSKGQNVVQIPMAIQGNTATVTMTSGACDVPGDNPCWVQVIKPDIYDLRVDGLILRVQPCNIDGAGEASAEFGALTKLIVQAKQAIEETNTAAGQATAAAGSANTAADTANTAAGQATAAAGSANTAASVANTAAGQATDAAQAAQTKGDYAQTQGNAAKAIIDQWQGLDASNLVPDTRTINAKPLSANITLSAADVGAQPQTAARNTIVKADASGNLVAAEEGKDFLKPKSTALVNAVYPVGSIYISVTNTNPSSLFGGTWAAFGTGRTLVGVDTTQNEFNTVQKTGGAKTHTLTLSQIPPHSHKTVEKRGYAFYGGERVYEPAGPASGTGYATDPNFLNTGSAGSGEAHNNLQPYITVYMWRRTA